MCVSHTDFLYSCLYCFSCIHSIRLMLTRFYVKVWLDATILVNNSCWTFFLSGVSNGQSSLEYDDDARVQFRWFPTKLLHTVCATMVRILCMPKPIEEAYLESFTACCRWPVPGLLSCSVKNLCDLSPHLLSSSFPTFRHDTTRHDTTRHDAKRLSHPLACVYDFLRKVLMHCFVDE